MDGRGGRVGNRGGVGGSEWGVSPWVQGGVTSIRMITYHRGEEN